jgi:RNA exonuclease 1
MWRLHRTPLTSNQTRQVVVFDCEMGVSITGDSEIISISAIDYFTGEILIDTLVYPFREIATTSPRFSGITRHELNVAESQGRCLIGTSNVRQKMWEFIGPGTVLVGHGLHNDLACLRWSHTRILDTCVLAKKRFAKKAEEKEEGGEENSPDLPEVPAAPVDKPPAESTPETSTNNGRSRGAQGPGRAARRSKGNPEGNSLKALVKRTLDRDIQSHGHSSMEDTIATRDLLHWLVTNKPEESSPGAAETRDAGSENAQILASKMQSLDIEPLNEPVTC